VDEKVHNFDAIVALEIERRKWGWHPFFDIFTTICALRALAPNVRLFRLYTFSKGLHIPSMHPLRGAIKKNVDNDFEKG
jgi:hypothetical protein